MFKRLVLNINASTKQVGHTAWGERFFFYFGFPQKIWEGNEKDLFIHHFLNSFVTRHPSLIPAESVFLWGLLVSFNHFFLTLVWRSQFLNLYQTISFLPDMKDGNVSFLGVNWEASHYHCYKNTCGICSLGEAHESGGANKTNLKLIRRLSNIRPVLYLILF